MIDTIENEIVQSLHEAIIIMFIDCWFFKPYHINSTCEALVSVGTSSNHILLVQQ
jgi:hypothetical protein